MLHLNIAVKEKPFYHVRTYILPECCSDLLLGELESIGVTALAAVHGLASCTSAAQILAEKLFAIQPQIEMLKLHKRSFTITFPKGCNGPEMDREVVIALREVVIQTLLLSVKWVDLEIQLGLS